MLVTKPARSNTHSAIKELIQSSRDLMGSGKKEGVLQSIYRGKVPINKLCSLIDNTKVNRESLNAYSHLVQIALRPDKTIFENHLNAYGSELDFDNPVVITAKQKDWYARQISKWEENEKQVNELLRDPYPALKLWMDKLNIKPEDLAVPLFDPHRIDRDMYIHPELQLRLKLVGLFDLKRKLNFTHQEYITILKEIAKTYSFSILTEVSVQNSIAAAGQLGTEEQIKALEDVIAAFGLTEPQSGSDALGSMQSTAELTPDGKYYILNGEKLFITMTHKAEVIYFGAKVIDKSNPDKPKMLPTVFILKLDPPFDLSDTPEDTDRKRGELFKKGIRISKPLILDPIRGSMQAHISLDNVQVPKESVLLNIGDGAKILSESLRRGRAGFAAFCFQASIGSFNQARFYAENRRFEMFKIYGPEGRLIDNPFIQIMLLAPMARRVVGLEAKAEMTNALIDQCGEHENIIAESAKIKSDASETLVDVARATQKLHGGAGFMKGHLNNVDRTRRDAEVTVPGEGHNDLMDQYSAGVALQGIKNDAETIQGHIGVLIKTVKSTLRDFADLGRLIAGKSPIPKRKEKETKKPFPVDIRGSLIPAIRNILDGLVHFEKGPLKWKDALWINLKNKILALKIMRLGKKYGKNLVKQPIELACMSKVADGIFGLVASYDALRRLEGKTDSLSYAKRITLERDIELTKQEINKNLRLLRFNNPEHEKDRRVIEAWLNHDMKSQGTTKLPNTSTYTNESYTIQTPYDQQF